MKISHERIYQYVWRDKREGGRLHEHLRGARKQRRKRYAGKDSRGRVAGKRPITERPASIERRRRIGHWEIDTVLGGRGKDCILTMVERKTGYLLIGKLKARTSEEATRAILDFVNGHYGRMKTITADNGAEFHSYRQIEEQSDVKFLLCDAAPLVGTGNQREYERPDPPISPEASKHGKLNSGSMRPDRAENQSSSQKTAKLQKPL